VKPAIQIRKSAELLAVLERAFIYFADALTGVLAVAAVACRWRRLLLAGLLGGDAPSELHPETLSGARVALLGKNGRRKQGSCE
jgi:hypothetical protein